MRNDAQKMRIVAQKMRTSAHFLWASLQNGYPPLPHLSNNAQKMCIGLQKMWDEGQNSQVISIKDPATFWQ
jgi:hypothetical protein